MEEKSKSEPRELCTLEGARRLAKELDAWWHERGYTGVRHWVESGRVGNMPSGETLFVVRCNLVRGKPPHV